MIDSHCHLTDKSFDADREAVLARAWAAGLTALVTIGAGDGMEGNERAAALVDHDPRIFAAIGLHPHDADQFTPELLSRIEELAAHPKVVAIGETGLDYHYDIAPRDKQHEAFRAQVGLAHRLGLPFVIHHREAEVDLFAILDDFPKPLHGVLHCFTGPLALGKRALDYGLYLSIPGVVTFKKAEALREALVHLPLDRLLIETDSPYLAPVPYRGKRNEPAFIVETARNVASLRKMELQELAASTADNAQQLFHLLRHS